MLAVGVDSMQCPSELAPDQYHVRSAAQAALDCFIVTLLHSMALGLRTLATGGCSGGRDPRSSVLREKFSL